MVWSSIQLRKLSLIGPNKRSASLAFRKGLNVICGASDTGKSFVVETIDFMTGGGVPLRDLPERVGYEQGLLTIETSEEESYTFSRSLDGGKFRLYNGMVSASDLTDEHQILKDTHTESEDSLSGWLLARTNLLGKKVKKNKQDEVRNLSFRDLARLIIIQENEVIRNESPFLTGQYITATSEKSVLKFLLSGIDDSALIANLDERGEGGIEAKIELIAELIDNLKTQLELPELDKHQLEDQLSKVESSILSSQNSLNELQGSLKDKSVDRGEAFASRERIIERLAVISDLLSRFDLLSKHYQIDLERLDAIEESGSLFYHESSINCPLCGAEPSQQHQDIKCDGDVESIVLAAKNEKLKIFKLSDELNETISGLMHEKEELNIQLKQVEYNYNSINSEIDRLLNPAIVEYQQNFKKFYDKKISLLREIDLYEQIGNLSAKSEDLSSIDNKQPSSEKVVTLFSKSLLDDYSRKVESILKAWNFPESERVSFDETVMDFVISGKARGSRGKGLRAITHAAVTLGLLEFCKERDLPHPGFVVIDSPLLAYWAPEGLGDSLVGWDLKEKFYQYIVNNYSDAQVILFENEHPPESLAQDINLTIFTKNPTDGRFGFFPY